MIDQTLIIFTGLALAAWGHLLMHDLLGAATAWTRADEHFPVTLRSSPTFAGQLLVVLGGVMVLAPIVG